MPVVGINQMETGLGENWKNGLDLLQPRYFTIINYYEFLFHYLFYNTRHHNTLLFLTILVWRRPSSCTCNYWPSCWLQILWSLRRICLCQNRSYKRKKSFYLGAIASRSIEWVCRFRLCEGNSILFCSMKHYTSDGLYSCFCFLLIRLLFVR